MFFPENVVIFLNSARSAAALVFYLPDVCTHTATERKQSPEYFKIFEKKTIFNEHPVYPLSAYQFQTHYLHAYEVMTNVCSRTSRVAANS